VKLHGVALMKRMHTGEAERGCRFGEVLLRSPKPKWARAGPIFAPLAILELVDISGMYMSADGISR